MSLIIDVLSVNNILKRWYYCLTTIYETRLTIPLFSVTIKQLKQVSWSCNTCRYAVGVWARGGRPGPGARQGQVGGGGGRRRPPSGRLHPGKSPGGELPHHLRGKHGGQARLLREFLSHVLKPKEPLTEKAKNQNRIIYSMKESIIYRGK